MYTLELNKFTVGNESQISLSEREVMTTGEGIFTAEEFRDCLRFLKWVESFEIGRNSLGPAPTNNS